MGLKEIDPIGAEIEELMAKFGEIRPENMDTKQSKIVQFFSGKTVFVSGATGFLGKLIVEKLLRACEDIETIYILVRPKKGVDEITRIEQLYNDVIFNPLRKFRPKFVHKIAIIKGDLALPDLGISAHDQQIIIDKVNIFFHIAATVKFDEKLKLATAINVRATKDLLKLAKQCKNLNSFLHVSTAFSNCNREVIMEKFYPVSISGDELIEICETIDDKQLEIMTNKIMEGWPNTYTFTKAMAENIIKTYAQGIPVCMVRPSIVVSTYTEPLRNWIDNLYGATGILIGCGLGLLRSVHCNQKFNAEIIPGDYVINTMITAAYKTGTEKIIENDTPIYNIVSSVENPINWEKVMNDNDYYGTHIPSLRCIWYYNLKLNKYYIMHKLYVLFLHFLPGIILDAGLLIIGKKPMLFNAYKKVTKFESVISHFCAHEWRFTNDNTQKLWQNLDKGDRQVFPFDANDINWTDYNKTHMFGLRRYIIKEDDSTLPEARKKYKRLFYLHQLVKIIFYVILIRIVYGLLATLFSYMP